MNELEGPRLISDSVVDQGFASARTDIGRFNLAIFGAAGVGKSTLLNTVFGTPLARTGIGEPVTQGSHLYRHQASQLGIFDTKGLEIGSDNRVILQELKAFIEDNRLGVIPDQIHVIWYCVRSGGLRIQPAEEAFIRAVSGLEIPVIIVLTQTPKDRTGADHWAAAQLAADIDAMGLPVRGPAIPINAVADDFAGTEAFGLEKLLAATAVAAPAGVRSALAAAQRVNRQQKHEQARSLIIEAEQRLRGRWVLTDVGRTWTELFAAIAAIYEIPEHDARSVFESIRTLVRLRRMATTANNGIVILGFLIPLVGAPMAVRKRRLRHPSARTEAPEPDEQSAQPQTPERIGSGLAVGKATRGIGEAWLEVCDKVWAEAFPDPPSVADPHVIAERFADDLAARLPRLLRMLDEREQRRSHGGEAIP